MRNGVEVREVATRRNRVVGLDVKVYNARMREARVALGFRSRPKFCRERGISYQTYLMYESFGISPLNRNGNGFKRSAMYIADALCETPEFLWPRAARRIGKVSDLNAALSELATAAVNDEAVPSVGIDTEWDTIEVVDRAIEQSLSKRENEMVRLRFGLIGDGQPALSFDEIATRYGVSQTRVVQIVRGAMDRLCKPEVGLHDYADDI